MQKTKKISFQLIDRLVIGFEFVVPNSTGPGPSTESKAPNCYFTRAPNVFLCILWRPILNLLSFISRYSRTRPIKENNDMPVED